MLHVCTSVFTDDVIFAPNGPYKGLSIPLQVAASNITASSCAG